MRIHVKNKNKWLFTLLISGIIFLSAPAVFAASSSTTIQANICRTSAFTAPVISEPSSGTVTEDPSVTVKGTAEPGMSVTILDNSSDVGTVPVASDGTFGASIPLTIGDNSLLARESDGCATEDSSSVLVRRTEVQQPNPPTSQPPSNQTSGSTSPPRQALNRFANGFLQGSGLPTSNESAPQGNEAGIQKPTISNSQAIIQGGGGRVWLTGKAQPGSLVIVYVNGVEVARVVAAEDGTYSVLITLKPGGNTVQVRSELKGRSMWSDIWHVRYQTQSAPSHAVYWGYYIIFLLVLIFIFLLLLWYVHRRHKREERNQ